MGPGALNVTLSENFNGSLRVYAHAGAPPSAFSALGSSLGAFVINLDATHPRSVNLSALAAAQRSVEHTARERSVGTANLQDARERSVERMWVWALTATDSRPFTGNLSINGASAPATIGDGVSIGLSPVEPEKQSVSELLQVAPLSVTVVSFV